jgi:hypothetical protein
MVKRSAISLQPKKLGSGVMFAHSFFWHESASGIIDRSELVVAGDCAELNSSEKKASFERFREQLNGVRILIFDEVYKRIKGLLAIFTDSSGISPQKST